MKILAINGSMRKNKKTNEILKLILEKIAQTSPNISPEIIHIKDYKFVPCQVQCSLFCSGNPYNCTIKDDVAIIFQKMIQADVILLGSPQYFRGPPAIFHTFVERLVSMAFFCETASNSEIPSPLRNKPCGLIGITEYSDPQFILEYLSNFCSILKMKPILLDFFPYLGIACQENMLKSEIYKPSRRIGEMVEKIEKLMPLDKN